MTVAVSTLFNSLGHSLLVFWGPEVEAKFNRWLQLGGMWTFVVFHGLFGLFRFSLRQFEIASSVLNL